MNSLETPDLEQIPELVAKMIDTTEYPSQRYFFYFNVAVNDLLTLLFSFGTALHNKMTLEQLEELRTKRPDLIDNSTYIEVLYRIPYI